jgi:hypothetical protein
VKVEQGSYEELCASGVLKSRVLEVNSYRETNAEEEELKKSLSLEELEGPDKDEVQDLDRKTGDKTVYKYYLKSIGARKLSVFIFFAVLSTFSGSFSRKFCFLRGRIVETAAKLHSRYLAEVVVGCSRPSAWIIHFSLLPSLPWIFRRNWRICLVRIQTPKDVIGLTA